MPNANGHKKTAVLYCRVSTDEQARSGFSLAQQLEALREYAEREGYEVLEEVTDPGQSGASLERPGMDRVRDLVAAGGVSVVLAQDRDRFAREPAYLYLLKKEFGGHDTKLRSLNDRGDDSPEGQLTDDVLDVIAKFERVKTAERTRRGRLRKAREGKLMAGRFPRHGFRLNPTRDGYELDEERMQLVRRVFRMIGEEGMTIRPVARRLDEEGIPTPAGGKFWDRTLLRQWILVEREGMRGDPEQEVKHWLEKLSEVDQERRGFLRLAAKGRITDKELDEELCGLEETRKVAEREMEALRGYQERIEQLERDKEVLLSQYADLAPEALDSLTPEERHRLYKMLRLRVGVYKDGSLEIELAWSPVSDENPDESSPIPANIGRSACTAGR